MRSIALTILLINLAYLAWIVWDRQQSSSPTTVIDPGPAGTSLLLLSESNIDDPQGQAENPASARLCTRAGVFPTLEDANQLIEEARRMGLDARLSLEGRMQPPQYRVYLPPYVSRDSAAQSLNTLQTNPAVVELLIESYLITRGDLENGIAFGVFADLADAEAVRDQLDALGYPVQMGEVPTAEGPVFVLLNDRETGPVSAQIWAQLVLDRPYLSHSENVC
ncbi:MAG: SPOR domain-containing protein [Pseudohongiellaceae bacterium]